MSLPVTSEYASEGGNDPLGGPLGNYTTFPAAPAALSGITVPDTGNLGMRFMLQSAARDLLPTERVGRCLRLPRFGFNHVEIRRTQKQRGNTAHYSNLCVCGSIWQCPVCAAKISEGRRVELSETVRRWAEGDEKTKRDGGKVVLVTFTLRHKHKDDLSWLTKTLKSAKQDIFRNRADTRIKQAHEIKHNVTSFEITYGKNGWHPHLHVLYLLPASLNITKFTKDMKELWVKKVKEMGGDATYEHGCDVRVADQEIADYIAKYGREPKWTIAHEMAKANVKRGKEGGYTPTELLYEYAVNGNAHYGNLWRDFARAMAYKSQLRYSNGLRKVLGMAELDDEDLAVVEDERAVLFARLTLEQWRLIVKRNARAEVLAAAAQGEDVFVQLLEALGIGSVEIVEASQVDTQAGWVEWDYIAPDGE